MSHPRHATPAIVLDGRPVKEHDLRGPWYVGPNYSTERNARENDAERERESAFAEVVAESIAMYARDHRVSVASIIEEIRTRLGA